MESAVVALVPPDNDESWPLGMKGQFRVCMGLLGKLNACLLLSYFNVWDTANLFLA